MAVEEEMFPARSARSPLVLVGAIATAGVLVAGLVAFKQVRRRWRSSQAVGSTDALELLLLAGKL